MNQFVFQRIYVNGQYAYEPVQICTVVPNITKSGVSFEYRVRRIEKDNLQLAREKDLLSLEEMVERCTQTQAMVLKNAARTDDKEEWLADIEHWKGCSWEDGKRPL